MRIVHLLEWPRPGTALRFGASATAAIASAAIARRPDAEHLVVVLGPSAAQRWAADAELPQPIVQIAPPTGQVALAGPALARLLRAAAPIDLIHAWSPAAGAVARRIGPAHGRLCATTLTSPPEPGAPGAPRSRYSRRWRLVPSPGTLITPTATSGPDAGTAPRAFAHVVETAIPRPTWPHARDDRAAARARLGLNDDTSVVLLVGDGADAVRFLVSCSFAAASGRRVCAVIAAGAAQARRALRTFVGSTGLLDCRVSDAPWTQLAAAADLGMIVEEGDITSATALSVAMGLGLPVIASSTVYQHLGVHRADAAELVSAAGTRAELARLVGPLLDDPALAMAGLDRAAARGGRASAETEGPRDFFGALDEAWSGREAHTIGA